MVGYTVALAEIAHYLDDKAFLFFTCQTVNRNFGWFLRHGSGKYPASDCHGTGVHTAFMYEKSTGPRR